MRLCYHEITWIILPVRLPRFRLSGTTPAFRTCTLSDQDADLNTKRKLNYSLDSDLVAYGLHYALTRMLVHSRLRLSPYQMYIWPRRSQTFATIIPRISTWSWNTNHPPLERSHDIEWSLSCLFRRINVQPKAFLWGASSLFNLLPSGWTAGPQITMWRPCRHWSSESRFSHHDSPSHSQREDPWNWNETDLPCRGLWVWIE